MAKERKTRREKVRSQYRLSSVLQQSLHANDRKRVGEFAYLSSSYIRRDLVRTILFSVVILTFEIVLSRFL